MMRRLLPALCLALIATVAFGGDWPQWNGPNRDGHSTDKGLLKEWPKDGPPLAWTFSDAGTGFSPPAVVGDRIYILGAVKGEEKVIALDAKGKQLWTAPIGKPWTFKENVWNEGPNSSPSVDGDRVYAVGSQGEVVCVETGKGDVVWRKSLVKDLGAEVNPIGGGPKTYGWGFSWSPLVDGKQVIVTPGGPKGLVAALDKTNGNVLWQTAKLTDQCTYASPIVADIAGVRQYLVMVQDGIVGVAAKDGEVLWRYKRSNPYNDIVANTPVYHDGQVLIAGYPGGNELVQITKEGDTFKTKKGAANRLLASMSGGLVRVGDHIYGAQEKRSWMCQEWKTGKIVWRADASAVGFGSLSYADGHLYLAGQDDDTVALIEASPEAYKEKGRFKLPRTSTLRKTNGKFWTHPVIANGHLFVRDQELLFCYKVK
jgi:outer membrane protein assembly factor BamB